MKKKLVTLLIGLFAAIGAFAQTETVDVVFLKNGKRHIGEILSYEQGEQLVLLDHDGERINIRDSKILKILQGVTVEEAGTAEEELKVKPVLDPKVKGFYNTTMLSFAMGNGNTNTLALGAGLSNVVSYQLKPHLGVGLGIGLDNYARRGETLYPVFLELKSYLPLKKRPWAYYVSMQGGYGMAFKRESTGVSEAEGGYMVHPAIGYRTATRDGVDVNIDLGVKLQKASFTHDLFNGDVQVRNLVFRRLAIRVGLSLWK